MTVTVGSLRRCVLAICAMATPLSAQPVRVGRPASAIVVDIRRADYEGERAAFLRGRDAEETKRLVHLRDILMPRIASAQGPTAPLEMMTYQMLLLKKGPKAPPAAADAQKKMQDAHLANLADLNRQRINVLYGPVLDGGDLTGVAILAVASADEARRLFASDPFVEAGVMVAEIHPWSGPKNWFHVPGSYDVTNPATLEPLVLGFLMRARNPPALDKATGDEVQKGHLAYMEALHVQGKLLVAGPFLDDSPMRGLVIYRVNDVAAAQALAAQDPAVKAGRLVLEAHRWITLRGILK